MHACRGSSIRVAPPEADAIALDVIDLATQRLEKVCLIGPHDFVCLAHHSLSQCTMLARTL